MLETIAAGIAETLGSAEIKAVTAAIVSSIRRSSLQL